MKCWLCCRFWIVPPDMAISTTNKPTCPHCVINGVEEPLPGPEEPSAPVGAGSSTDPSASVRAGPSSFDPYDSAKHVLITSAELHRQVDTRVTQLKPGEMGPSPEQLKRAREQRKEVMENAKDERGNEQWYSNNIFNTYRKYSPYTFPYSSQYVRTQAVGRAKSLPEKCKIILNRILELLNYTLHDPEPFTVWAGVSSQSTYQRIISLMRAEGMHVPTQFETIATSLRTRNGD